MDAETVSFEWKIAFQTPVWQGLYFWEGSCFQKPASIIPKCTYVYVNTLIFCCPNPIFLGMCNGIFRQYPYHVHPKFVYPYPYPQNWMMVKSAGSPVPIPSIHIIMVPLKSRSNISTPIERRISIRFVSVSARFVSSEALSLWAALGGCNCKVRGVVCERLVALIFGLWNHCSWH